MDEHGFFRVAAASPRVAIAHPEANARAMLELLRRATEEGVELVVFPELSLTGYTCGDLFNDRLLLTTAREAVVDLARESASVYSGLFVVGLPLVVEDQLFNGAALIQQGKILGIVPKRYLPNEKEFYEQRWFTPWNDQACHQLDWPPLAPIPVQQQVWRADGDEPSTQIRSVGIESVGIGIEICEDLWTPIPRSTALAFAGAHVLCNPSASNDIITKADYRRQLVATQSARLIAGYVYASCGVSESTTDLVFGGHSIIAENGVILAESKRFSRQAEMIVADLDIERLTIDRLRTRSWNDQKSENLLGRVGQTTIRLPVSPRPSLRRWVPAHPFVPSQQDRLRERCEEIYHIQVAGLAKRVESARPQTLHIGVSGGLDSTLALLVAVKTCDQLGMDRTTIHGLTMPGFGTSEHTRSNAHAIMQHLGISADTIDIRPLALDSFRALGHRPFGIDPTDLSLDEFAARLRGIDEKDRHDLVFENVQARLRTFLLMSRGFVVGTGDMSELALGWATYNGDHMSMYNPNVSIPKTLVRFLVRWAADYEFDGETRKVLHSIADTEISPELLPLGNDGLRQSTERSLGPYELHDFILYHFLRFGFRPAKIYRLAREAHFEGTYEPGQIKHWLGEFFRRFFRSQYKRSCLPDGPKVGSISLSPRGDWRMPSDADVSGWLAEIDSLDPQ
jgi:NAD+ synthase (glutamine-hydrolysing)